jgi:dUTP pyrophosphatase
MIELKVKKMHVDAVIPHFNYDGDSGFDLHTMETVTVKPNETVTVDVGLAFELPPGYEIEIRPRSGVSRDTSLKVILGTVDNNYRGSVGITVHNSHPTISVDIWKGFKLAQAVVQEIPKIKIVEVMELNETVRGVRGFGHTGV